MNKLSRVEAAGRRLEAVMKEHLFYDKRRCSYVCRECGTESTGRNFVHAASCRTGQELSELFSAWLNAYSDKRTTWWRRFRCWIGWHKRQGMIDFMMGREYWRCEWCGRQKTTYPKGNVDWDKWVNGPQGEEGKR